MVLCSWKQFYANFDRSVQLEMLLCSWKRFHASLDGSVRLDMLLCSWKRFHASFDGSVQQEMLICSWKQFYSSLERSVHHDMLLCCWMFLCDESVLQWMLSVALLAGTPFLNFPAKIWTGLCWAFLCGNANQQQHSQSQSGKRRLLASCRGQTKSAVLWQTSFKYPTLVDPHLGLGHQQKVGLVGLVSSYWS